MASKVAEIKNQMGIHVRPSGLIIEKMKDYEGSITIKAGYGKVDLSDIMGLLSLGLACGDRIKVEVSGPDEDKVCSRVVELFETRFDFPPREGS